MLAWFTERRRRRLRTQPFPPSWEAYIDRNVAVARRLDAPSRRKLRELVQVFVAEKYWEGCGDLELTEEMQVTIAAQACLLLLGRDEDLFKDVASIIIYPSAVIPPPRPRAFFEVNHAPVAVDSILDGEAMLHGPIVLSWDAVRSGGDPFATRNVVIHELAHKIDMADGAIDGTPPLATEAEIEDWARICSRELRALRERIAQGIPTLIDPYGATNEAEFFAVVTETFFLQPFAMRIEHPDLYAIFAKFYRVELDVVS